MASPGCEHRYQYDIFVSYSSRDREWVHPFYTDLVAEINRLGERDIEPYLDQTRLAPGFVWDDALESAASNSAVLVPVLSPRFFGSPYCQKEIQLFTEASGLRSAISHRSRIVPVRHLCEAPTDHLLSKIQVQPFCEIRNGIPYEHKRGTKEYSDALKQTAWAIVQILQKLGSVSERGAVYLASTGPELKAERDKLRSALSHHYDVLPDNAADLLESTPRELEQSLTADLNSAFVSIHPADLRTATPPGASSTLAELQLQAAAATQKARLVWQPAAATSIDYTRRDELCNRGFQWIESSDALQDHILRLWRKLTEPKLVPPSERCIYFICPDRANKQKAEELGILSVLKTRHYDVYFSPLEQQASHAMQSHVEALAELDGCLIYYGDADPDWFQSVFLRVRKAMRQRPVPRAVFLAPPPNTHKQEDLPYLGIPILDPAGKTIEQTIAPFLAEFERI